MPTDVKLPLRDIIGIPLADIARAEMQIAQASMEFIENVGFKKDPKKPTDDLGELRFVTFRYTTTDDTDGKDVVREVRVPLLALLPLPLLQISKAEIELAARVQGIEKIIGESVVVSIKPRASDALAPDHVDFIATVDSVTQPPDGKGAQAPRIHIKVEVVQSDVPAGISYLLRKLDETSRDKVK